MLAKAKAKLKETGERDDGEPGEIVASLQLCLDTLAASTSPRTPGAKGPPAQPPQSRRRAGSTPPTPKAATPKSMADGAAMQAAQCRGAGVMYLLHSEFPKTCRHLTGGKPPAPIEGMSAPALRDVVSYLESQKFIHHLVWLSLGASPTHVAATMAITGKVSNTTFCKLLEVAPGAYQPPPLFRAYGVISQGDGAMGLARQNWEAGRTKASAALLALVRRLSLVDDRGNLNLPSPTAQLVAGMSAAGDGKDDNDYDPLCRAAVAMIAGALSATFRATAPDGVVHDW